MATPNLLQIDDHNPLVFYSPNTSWGRGGVASESSDFDGTSTFTTVTGASATLTFTGMHFIPVLSLVLYLILTPPKAQGLAFGEQSSS